MREKRASVTPAPQQPTEKKKTMTRTTTKTEKTPVVDKTKFPFSQPPPFTSERRVAKRKNFSFVFFKLSFMSKMLNRSSRQSKRRQRDADQARAEYSSVPSRSPLLTRNIENAKKGQFRSKQQKTACEVATHGRRTNQPRPQHPGKADISNPTANQKKAGGRA